MSLSSYPARKRATRRAHRSGAADHSGRFRRISLGITYLVALSLLIVWEYRERLEGRLSSDCELRDSVKSSLYNLPYERFLDWASSGAAGHVVTLAIPQELEEVQKNLCLGREYMADVLRVLATHNPSVVVVDKFYSPGTCTSAPASTNNLIQAAGAVKSPVIIGESTNGLEREEASTCLARKSQLDFNAPNVSHGLTRINMEPERLPLRWLVLSSGPKPEEAQAEFADTLSFAAVKAYDPAFAAQRKIRRLVADDDHSYANLAIEIPRLTTTELLCASGDPALRRKWSLACPAAAALPSLAGKVMVVGAETGADQKLVLDRRIWGFELQARYIEALLSGDYLFYLPIWWGLVVFGLFVFLIEGLPTILVARRPRWKRLPFLRYAYRHHHYLWVSVWAVVTIIVSAFVTLALRYLPPLLVYGDILFVTVTRLLFFLAESAEHPFLHAHSHRKAHAMSTSHSSAHQSNSSTPLTHSSDEVQVSPMAPFVPDQPAEPAPVPTSGNKPGSEGGSEG